jgi:hypothetical protein
MKHYQLHFTLNFGKNRGQTIAEILDTSPSYIKWCLIHLDHFNVSDEVWRQLNSRYAHLADAELVSAYENKNQIIEQSEEDFRDGYDYEDDYGSSGEKYGWYNGWSDDAIDDAFEGDPMNTWNVD